MKHLFCSQKKAIILTTILHEIMNMLRREIINENYFISTTKFQRDSINYVDLGDYFDFLLYGEFRKIFEKDAKFLLNDKNWQESKLKNYGKVKAFKEQLIKIRNKISEDEKNKTGYLAKSSSVKANLKGGLTRGFCYFHIFRMGRFEKE